MGRIASRPQRFVVPLLGAGAALYLYLNLFRLLDIPLVLGGDQVYFWMNAHRMLFGERIYQDFFQATPPGTDLVYFAAFKVFGAQVAVTNTVVLLLGVALCLVCFSISSQMMKPSLAILCSLLFLALLYGTSLTGTHHWFSLLLIMAAIAILVRRHAAKELIAAGALIGCATFFTQTHGAVAFLAVATALSWEHFAMRGSWRGLMAKAAFLVVGFGAALSVVYAHYLITVGLRQLWYFQVTHVRRYLLEARAPFLGLPDAPGWRKLPTVGPPLTIYILLIAIYPLTVFDCWRRRRSGTLGDLWPTVLLALTGSFLLIEVFVSPNWLRIYAVAMPAIVLFFRLIGRLRTRYITAALWLLLTAVGIGQISYTQLRHLTIGELRGRTVATSPDAYAKLRWVDDRTSPNEFFFQAPWPGMYLPLQLRNPVFLDAASPFEATRPEFIEASIRQLDDKHVRFVLWSPGLIASDPRRPHAGQLQPMRAFLSAKYHRIHVFPDGDEIWQRN